MARERRTPDFTRRRSAALAVAALVVVLLVALLVSLIGGDDDSRQTTPGRPLASTPRTARTVAVPTVGIRIGVPRGWTSSKDRYGVTLRSDDRSVAVSAASPPGTTSAARALTDAVRAIKREYTGVRAVRTAGGHVAGRPTSSVVVAARSRRGTRLRILVATAQGRGRAWVVEFFAVEGGRPARLVEGQVALRTLKLSG